MKYALLIVILMAVTGCTSPEDKTKYYCITPLGQFVGMTDKASGISAELVVRGAQLVVIAKGPQGQSIIPFNDCVAIREF